MAAAVIPIAEVGAELAAEAALPALEAGEAAAVSGSSSLIGDAHFAMQTLELPNIRSTPPPGFVSGGMLPTTTSTAPSSTSTGALGQLISSGFDKLNAPSDKGSLTKAAAVQGATSSIGDVFSAIASMVNTSKTVGLQRDLADREWNAAKDLGLASPSQIGMISTQRYNKAVTGVMTNSRSPYQ